MAPEWTSAAAALHAIRSRQASVAEVTASFLARLDAAASSVHALRDRLDGSALIEAGILDERLSRGEEIGPLGGLPVVVKENCGVRGIVCSAGLHVRRNHVSARDSWVTAALRRAGAVIVGTAISDPGAFGVRTPDVTHPLDPTLTVGGSSGGSAAALLADLCLGAIGTDTGGSIRIPSACCGTAGLKPTSGSLPPDGVFPLVPSLDHVGPMGRSVADVELLWDALNGTSRAAVHPPRLVGFDPSWVEEADDGIRRAFADLLERLRAERTEVIEVALPEIDAVCEMHGRIFFVESAAYHLAHHADDVPWYPSIARDWFGMGLRMSVAAYVEACRRRVQAKAQVDEILRTVDFILTPTMSVLHPSKAGDELAVAGRSHDYTLALVRQTCLFNHTGHPALALPLGRAVGLVPPSLQIVGRHGSETTMLKFGRKIELP